MRSQGPQPKAAEIEAAIRDHYDATAGAEGDRLQHRAPLELAMMTRYLARWIPAGSQIVDVGSGAGHYSELLAARHCGLRLVDLSPQLLATAIQRLRSAGLESHLLSATEGSATELTSIAPETCDAALLLGPLYHLTNLLQRAAAVAEIARILKPGGLILAAGINRLAYFRDLWNGERGVVRARCAFHRQFMTAGNLDPENAPVIGFAHLTTMVEFRALFQASFDELQLVGIESFAAGNQDALNSVPPEDTSSWLDLVEQTGATPEGAAASDHFLFVGRKRGRPANDQLPC